MDYLDKSVSIPVFSFKIILNWDSCFLFLFVTVTRARGRCPIKNNFFHAFALACFNLFQS